MNCHLGVVTKPIEAKRCARGRLRGSLNIVITVVVGLAAVSCNALLWASPITFAFQAVSQENYLGFEIAPGTTASGTFTFESTTPPNTNGNPAIYTNAVTAVSVELSGVGTATSTGPGTIIVGDPETIVGSDPGTADFYEVNNVPISGFSVSGVFGAWNVIGFFLTLEDRSDTALSSDALPVSPPNPASYSDLHSISLNFESSQGSTAAPDLVVTSLTLVPEPSMVVLGAIAVAGLGCGAWRRRRAASRVNCS